MAQTSLLASIEDTPWIADLLASIFDFDVTDPQHTPIEPIRLASDARMDPIARDAAGGTYYLCGEDGEERPVLYTDSEGGAALLAPSLAVGTTAHALSDQRLQAHWAVASARIRLPLRTRSGVDRVPVPGGLPPRAQAMNARLDPARQVTLMGPAVVGTLRGPSTELLRRYRNRCET
jgi:hypothetical protein